MLDLSRKRRLIAFAISFICVACIVIGVSASKPRSYSKPAQAIKPHVTNKTNALRILDVKKVGDSEVAVTMLNQSGKTIFGYTFTMGVGSIMTYLNPIPLAPGATTIERIPFGNLESAAVSDPSSAGELVVSAVYLEGGTSEGVPPYTDRLNAHMHGIKEQASRVVQILREAMDSSEQDPDLLLRKVESQASSMPVKDEHVAGSLDHEGARSFVNYDVAGKIRNLRKMNDHHGPGFDARAHFSELISFYQELAGKL